MRVGCSRVSDRVLNFAHRSRGVGLPQSSLAQTLGPGHRPCAPSQSQTRPSRARKPRPGGLGGPRSPTRSLSVPSHTQAPPPADISQCPAEPASHCTVCMAIAEEKSISQRYPQSPCGSLHPHSRCNRRPQAPRVHPRHALDPCSSSIIRVAICIARRK